jgi:polyisoprenyl-phosphate glycosyltransferase
MVACIDDEQVPLVYDRDARVAGESKYPFTRMLRFAVDTRLGDGCHRLRRCYQLGRERTGRTHGSRLGLADGPGGLLACRQFLMLGIIAAYLGRLYDQSEGRPLFMIRDRVGGATEMAAAARTGVAILAPTAHPPDYPDCR